MVDTRRLRANRTARTSVASYDEGVNLQRKHRPDYQIMLFMGLLMLLGLIIMYAIGPQRANILNRVHGTDFYTENYFVIKQFVSLTLAGIAFFVMSRIPFTVLKQWSWRLVQIALGLCALLFIGGNLLQIDAIAVNTLGAYRWFNLGPLGTFQPAEVLKFSLLIYIAVFLAKRHREGTLNDLNASIYPVVGLTGFALFIVVVLQKDMGTGISIAATVATMFIMSGIKWNILAKIAGVTLVLGVLMIVTSPHRMERIGTFLQGDNASTIDAEDNNYHIKNAMIALGTGGFLGLGIGNSVQATGYLPEAINDSVFAIMGEIFGFVGVVVILILFTALLLRLLKLTDRLDMMAMRLMAAGVFGWLAAHTLLNIASMVGLIPLTGITLPLLSFGGTSMVFVAGALGLAYQLSRYTSHRSMESNKEGAQHENTRSRRGVRGARYSGRRSYQ